jgi:hypothetical protein
MTRLRGHSYAVRGARLVVPPGPRRRYQRSSVAALDMLSPVLALLVLAVLLGVSGVLALRR